MLEEDDDTTDDAIMISLEENGSVCMTARGVKTVAGWRGVMVRALTIAGTDAFHHHPLNLLLIERKEAAPVVSRLQLKDRRIE